MSVASDFFIAEFGDRFLEFELSVDAIRYEDGDAVVDWSVTKINNELGGITWEIVLNTVGGTDTAVKENTGFSGSGTLRAPADPGSTVDLILYDTFNTDHEPGDGLGRRRRSAGQRPNALPRTRRRTSLSRIVFTRGRGHSRRGNDRERDRGERKRRRGRRGRDDRSGRHRRY